MALANAYVQTYGQIPDFFGKLGEGQAPERFTRQHLKDLGFAKPSHHPFIPLLKTLGFLSGDGSPSARYHEYRDPSQSRRVMAEAIHEAYGDIFTIKAKPTKADQTIIEGKFKSAHNCSERSAKLMASTFLALLNLADIDHKVEKPKADAKAKQPEAPPIPTPHRTVAPAPGLHYNIQIHLPPSKDIEVFNAIFKSLREHLID